MIKNYDEAGFSYFLVQSAPRYQEPEPDDGEEKEVNFLMFAVLALSVLLIISMFTTLWVLI